MALLPYRTSYRFTKYSFDSQCFPSASCYFFSDKQIHCEQIFIYSFHTLYFEGFFFVLCKPDLYSYPRQANQLDKGISASNKEQLAFLLRLTKPRVTGKNVLILVTTILADTGKVLISTSNENSKLS